jgi:predicted nucleic-acid-binding protein
VTPRFLLDTNVLVRFFTGDDAGQSPKAKQLFAAAEDGKCALILLPWVVAETIYVLVGVYQLDRSQVADHLRQLIRSPGVTTEDRKCLLDALDRFEAKKVDFADALLVAESVARGVRPVSFDKDLDKFADVKRLEPGQPIA